jgi:Tfp pilus assembly protein PilF
MKPTATLFALSLIGAASLAHAQCDPYKRTHPGGDYTNGDDRTGLAVVEKFHFTPNIEHLVRGESGQLGGEIGYTLEHFPNHHRALAAMAKLGLRDKTAKPGGATYSIACYFDRAIGFKPGDAKVRTIYGAYLLAMKQTEQAMTQLREAARLSPDDPTVNYNLGLMYLKKNDYQQARMHARKAYGHGFPLPGLKNKLSAAGHWSRADEAPAEKFAAPDSAGAAPAPEPEPAPQELPETQNQRESIEAQEAHEAQAPQAK